MASLTYLEPVLSLVILVLVSGIYAHRRRILAGATVLLFLWSWEPVAALLSRSLECWYPIQPFPAGEPEAIVVLSGGIYPHDNSLPEDLPRPDTYIRTSYASWLYRNWRPLPILVSGGAPGGSHHPPVAVIMRRVLEEKGVPSSMIWTESRSLSTYENALYSAQFLRAKGISRVALVTEAYHMLRSERAFRRQGLTVSPAPCAYRYILFTGKAEHFIPAAAAIEKNEVCLHEWLGLLWYRVSGKA